MKAVLDLVVPVATEAALAALPDGVVLAATTLLPRGADPFIGTERPLLFGAARWAAVSPGGVLLGGSPAAMAAVLGFELPERTLTAGAVAAADDGQAEVEEGAPGPDEPADPEHAEPTAAGLPPARWTDQVCEAARAQVTTVAQTVAQSVARLGELPTECAAVQVLVLDNVRPEVGPLPDAVVLTLQHGPHEVRLVVVVPGIFLARVAASQLDGDSVVSLSDDAGPGAGKAAAPSLRPRLSGLALTGVPLDLAVRVGSLRLSLAEVLALADGDVLQLDELVDDAVELVAGSTPVAEGTLELGDHGTLELRVTAISH